jgi:hypothetical protein
LHDHSDYARNKMKEFEIGEIEEKEPPKKRFGTE